MNKFLLPIDQYINDETPDFRQFYNWFQDAYFGDQDSKVRDCLQQDEIDFLNTVNDLLAYAGATPEERNDGINDQYKFQQQLKDLKAQNASHTSALDSQHGLNHRPRIHESPLHRAVSNR